MLPDSCLCSLVDVVKPLLVLLCDNEQGELEEIEMALGKGYSNIPGQRHRLIAIEDCDFIEASTRESGATYRLEDDSGRVHETEEVRARDRSGTAT